MIVEKYMTEIYHVLIPESNINLSLTNYLAQNQATCGLIHLAGFEGNGYGKGHGVPLKYEDDVLIEFVRAYNLLNYDCPITLEVREDDYCNPHNYQIAKDALLRRCERECGRYWEV